MEEVKSKMGISFRDLEVWQLSRDLAVEVYDLSRNFPDSEKFGLSSQLRRAAVSVSSNIAEGHGRRGDNQFAYFLQVALGSLAETESLVEVAAAIGLMPHDGVGTLRASSTRLGVKLNNLLAAVNRRRVSEDVEPYDPSAPSDPSPQPSST